jgi:hypothetical protein
MIEQDDPPLRSKEYVDVVRDLYGIRVSLRLSSHKVLYQHIAPIPLPGLYFVYDHYPLDGILDRISD